MRKFKRRGNAIVTHLDSYEVHLLSSLVNQLIEMVSEGQPRDFAPSESSDDLFETLAKELRTVDGLALDDEPATPQDPVLKRLFPAAYNHDPEAASDFRRFTERDLKTTKILEARTVLGSLDSTGEGSVDLQITPGEVEPWLRTLASVRLAVATRLGITDAEAADELAELSDDDPRAYMLSVYDWLGFAQETLVDAL